MPSALRRGAGRQRRRACLAVAALLAAIAAMYFAASFRYDTIGTGGVLDRMTGDVYRADGSLIE